MNEAKTESWVPFFAVGRQYSLSKVNEIIAQHYRHQAQLRWSLLSAQLLKHGGNIFWRAEVA